MPIKHHRVADEQVVFPVPLGNQKRFRPVGDPSEAASSGIADQNVSFTINP
jgi:hypothetical protein